MPQGPHSANAARTVRIDCDRITDWQSFHAVFAAALSFPAYYGCNMNAWIDVMSDADVVAPHAERGVLVLDLAGAAGLRTRLPDIWSGLVECTLFVNSRWLEEAEPVFIVLAAGRLG